MRKLASLFFLLSVCFFIKAQKPRNTYYYTATSQMYLTDAVVDSLFYDEANRFLSEYGIPQSMVKKTYPQIKLMLVTTSKPGIVQAFTMLEIQNQIKRPVDVRDEHFVRTKALYITTLQEQVRKSVAGKNNLSKYTPTNKSDRITWFNSVVRVGTDGKLLVQENIRIYNGSGQTNMATGDYEELQKSGLANDEIKRGIVRAFPLYYINKNKLFQNTTFTLISVFKDGKPEDFHTKNYENGILVYTGSQDVFLKDGTYNYSITYETDHQLKNLKDFDELYWNVTGNGWSFRIDSAMCTIILPLGANVLSSKCYTGAQGSSNENCQINNRVVGDSAVIVFKTTKPLLPKEGITIATSWQKGIVATPTAWKQFWYYIWNNPAVFFLPIAALLAAFMSFLFWLKHGRDPAKGAIQVLFNPPAGFSPAALGYVFRQQYSQQLTAATLVDAAVRNKIKIDVQKGGLLFKHNAYIIKENKAPDIAPTSRYADFEQEIQRLAGTRIEKGKHNSSLETLSIKIENYLDTNYRNSDGSLKKGGKGFFAINRKYLTPPIFLCMLVAIWSFFAGVIKAFQLSNFWQIGYYIGGIIICIIVLKIFANLLKAYNPEGRLLVDKIEGFRMFLTATDEHRFDVMNPPEKSLELYEKYLPFAIALDCENAWGKKFEDIIKTAVLGGAAASSFTQSFAHDHNDFSSSFASSFSGAISSASTPPSSSSDGGSSFGGGSSGGGGGGGGGGGW